MTDGRLGVRDQQHTGADHRRVRPGALWRGLPWDLGTR
jgi:hypothetical protein